MTYATDLMLLLLDPTKGRPVADSTRLPLVLGGAVLLELRPPVPSGSPGQAKR